MRSQGFDEQELRAAPQYTHDSAVDILGLSFASVAKMAQEKWSMAIIWLPMDSTLRFSEPKRAIPFMADASLTNELRALEGYGVVRREAYPAIPPKAEHSLTEAERAFHPALEAILRWSSSYSAGVCEQDEGTRIEGPLSSSSSIASDPRNTIVFPSTLISR